MRPREFYQDQLYESKDSDIFTRKSSSKFLKEPYKFFSDLYSKYETSHDYDSIKKIEYFEALIMETIADGDLEDHEVKCINETKRFFFDKLRECSQKNSTLMLFSVLLQNRRDVQGMFTNDELNEIDSYENRIKNVAINVFKKCIMKNIILTPREKNALYSYLINAIGSNDVEIEKTCDYCFNYLINNNMCLSPIELEFFGNYLCYKDWNNGITFCPKVYIGIDEKNTFGESIDVRKDIKLSKNFSKKPVMELYDINSFENTGDLAECIESLPFVIFHEVQHQRQSFEKSINSINLTTLYTVISDILYKYHDEDFNEMLENYAYSEIEDEANMVAAYKTKEFSEKYFPDQLIVYDKTSKYYSRKFSKSVINNRNKNKIETVTYNIERLAKIFEEHPEEKNYDVFKIGFDSKGKIKNFYDFITEYSNKLNNGLTKGEKDVYDYFFKYYIYTAKKYNLNLSKMDIYNEEDNIAYTILLKRFVMNELDSLKNLFDTFNSFDAEKFNSSSDEYNNIIDERVDALIAAYSAIYENEDINKFILSSNIKNKKVKLNELKDTMKAIKDSNLTSYVLNNPYISNSDYFLMTAKRVDHMSKDIWSSKSRDIIRKIIKSKPVDSINTVYNVKR